MLPVLVRRFFYRHQTPLPLYYSIRSGFKGFIIISLLMAMSYYSDIPLVMAPFGASCILVATMPHQTLSQPINVIGGYFIGTLVTLAFMAYFSHQWWLVGLMLSVTISFMAILRVTHPPAGAVPFVIFFYEEDVGLEFLLFPVLTGSVLIVVMAYILHSIPPERGYPMLIPSNKKSKKET